MTISHCQMRWTSVSPLREAKQIIVQNMETNNLRLTCKTMCLESHHYHFGFWTHSVSKKPCFPHRLGSGRSFREQKPVFPHRLGHIVGAGSLPEIFRNLPGPSLAVTAPGFPKIFQAASRPDGHKHRGTGSPEYPKHPCHLGDLITFPRSPRWQGCLGPHAADSPLRC